MKPKLTKKLSAGGNKMKNILGSLNKSGRKSPTSQHENGGGCGKNDGEKREEDGTHKRGDTDGTSVVEEGKPKKNPKFSLSIFDCGRRNDLASSFESLLGVDFSFSSMYKVIKPLRSGSYATVFMVRHNVSKKPFAVKEIDRRKLKPKDDKGVVREVEILRALAGHPGIIGVVDFFTTPHTYHVVLELAAGGDVFDRLAKRTVYTEREARILARRLLEAIEYMHGRGVAHRDLKAENVLLMDENDEGSIKIADFGFATYYMVESLECCSVEDGDGGSGETRKKVLKPKRLTTRCGTPAYVAPEILLGVPYNQQVDMWSCGVLLFILLGGYTPFNADNRRSLFRKIRAADYIFEPKHWDHISVDAKQLVASFLVPDPTSRLDARTALKENAWLNYPDEETLSGRDLKSSLANMRIFNAKRKLRGAVYALRWAVKQDFFDMENVSFSHQKGGFMGGSHQLESMAEEGSTNSTATSPTASGSGAIASESKGSGTKPAWPSLKKKAVAPPPTIITFDDLYELTDKLRAGSFATVWLGRQLRVSSAKVEEEEGKGRDGDAAAGATDVPPADANANKGRTCAIKVVERANLQPKDDAAVLNEVAILQSVRDPRYVVSLLDFFEEPSRFYIVMEMMDGGDVFDRIVQRKSFNECDARQLARKLLKAVDHIHSHQVAHRDLKPQNLLLTSIDDDSDIKVADFGFAKRVHTPNSLTTRCGTPTYVAPEILKNHPHDHMVDMWSVGVIIYCILVGYPPFLEDDQRALFQRIRLGLYEFYEEDWLHISNESQDLIKSLLVVDPLRRLSARQALRSKWVKDLDNESLGSRNLSGSQMELRKSMGGSVTTLKGAVHAVRWMNASQSQQQKSRRGGRGRVGEVGRSSSSWFGAGHEEEEGLQQQDSQSVYKSKTNWG